MSLPLISGLPAAVRTLYEYNVSRSIGLSFSSWLNFDALSSFVSTQVVAGSPEIRRRLIQSTQKTARQKKGGGSGSIGDRILEVEGLESGAEQESS